MAIWDALVTGRRDCLVTDPGRHGDIVTGWAAVDQDHPVFFDHPLDHVPGILLLAAILDLVRQAEPGFGRAGQAVRLRFEFTDLCLLDLPVRLEAERGAQPVTGASRWSVRARQGGALVGTGFLRCGPPTQPAAQPAAQPATRLPVRSGHGRGWPEPAPAHLTNRRNPANVLIGRLDLTEREVRVDVLLPEPPHVFALATGRHLDLLVEAARQLMTLCGHLVNGRGAGTKVLLGSVVADLPDGGVFAGPVSLHWPRRSFPDRQWHYDFAVQDTGTGTELGTVGVSGLYTDQAGYDELYQRRRVRAGV